MMIHNTFFPFSITGGAKACRLAVSSNLELSEYPIPGGVRKHKKENVELVNRNPIENKGTLEVRTGGIY